MTDENRMPRSRGKRGAYWTAGALGAAAVVWFVLSMCLGSVWRWTFLQPEYWLAVLELTVLGVALVAAAYFPRKRWQRFLLILALAAVFSFLHSFFFALLVGMLYACVLWMTGYLLCSLLAREWRGQIPACLLLGMAGMLLLVCVCSLLRFGTSSDLRDVLKVLIPLELILCRKKLAELWRRCRAAGGECTRMEFPDALLLGGILTAFLLQLGRACISLDYDSLWYGLRSDAMLAPFTGIYDRVISTGCVYVYPKAIEALALPFNIPSTYSFVYAVNLMFAACLLYLVYRIVCLFCSRRTALFSTLCCAVTPGIMNMAVTAKSDTATLLIQLILLYYALEAIQKRSGGALGMAFAAGVFSLAFKTSSFVFTPLLLLTAILVSCVRSVRIRVRDLAPLLPVLLALVLIFLRTYLLTGRIITSFFTGLQDAMGLTYQFPYAVRATVWGSAIADFFSSPQMLLGRLTRIPQFLFLPTSKELDHVIIAWPGLLFSVTWLLEAGSVLFHPGRTLRRAKQEPVYGLLLLSLTLVSVVSFGCIVFLRKPDGNYFMLMYALTFLFAPQELAVRRENRHLETGLVVVPLVLCGYVMCLLSSWSWSVGLTPIRLNHYGFFNHEGENLVYYEQIGITETANYLRTECGGQARVMTVTGETPRILTLPAIADSWEDLVEWGTADLGRTPEGFSAYCSAAGITHLLIEEDYLAENAQALSVLRSLASGGWMQTVMRENGFWLVRCGLGDAEPDTELTAMLLGIVPAASE